MAPELALAELRSLDGSVTVLDPMAGSGTVLRHASEVGHRAIGFDMDPLAILMTKVWTTPFDDAAVADLLSLVMCEARATRADDMHLTWIDDDEETRRFVDYWFAEPQRAELRSLAHTLAWLGRVEATPSWVVALDILRLALSRIIVTKDNGVSLARDVSHSRPHKVAETSKVEVLPAFDRSVRQLRHLLTSTPPPGNVEMNLGDARRLDPVGDGTVDAVLTSPPYLNAIDYMRGHRLSLVWLGHRLSDLRSIRANSIGTERGRDATHPDGPPDEIQAAMGALSELPARHRSMVARYAEDVYRVMLEIKRVLRSTGRAILVVGNSCLKGTFIRNSDGTARAAEIVGLKLIKKVERELPNGSRYLPMPSGADVPLGKRMRTETILTFAHL